MPRIVQPDWVGNNVGRTVEKAIAMRCFAFGVHLELGFAVSDAPKVSGSWLELPLPSSCTMPSPPWICPSRPGRKHLLVSRGYTFCLST